MEKYDLIIVGAGPAGIFTAVELLRLLCAQMADRAVHQLQAGMDGVLADLLDLLAGVDALHMGVCAELKIDLVGVVDKLLCKLLSDQGGQVAAHLIGEAQLAIREGTCTGKAGGDGAGGAAVDAVAHFGFGAVALFHGLAACRTIRCAPRCR